MMKNLLITMLLIGSTFSLFSQNLLYYVDADATGNNDGTTWADAFTSLKEAVDTANAQFPTGIAEIWVAEGTYKPVNQTTPFTLQRNIHIYGGFDGTEFNLEDRDFRNNLTIIDGDLNGDDNSNITVNEATRSDNAYNLFKIEGVFVILDGLVLQGANGSDNQSGSRWFYDGSAIFYDFDAYNGEVRNCVIRNNSAIGSISFSWAGADIAGNYGAGIFRGNEFYNNYSGGTLFRFTCYSSANVGNAPNHTTSFQNNLIHSNTISAWTTGGLTSIMYLDAVNFGSNNYSGLNYFQDVSQNTFADNTLPANNSSVIRHVQRTSSPSSALGSQYLFITDNIFSQNGGVTTLFWDSLLHDKKNAQAVFWRNLIEDGDSILAADLGSFSPSVFGNIYGEAPGFTDRAIGDYTIIGCDKPGNDRGGSWLISSPTATDFYGNPRVVGTGSDIGHAEVQDEFTNLDLEQVGQTLVATSGYEPYTWADVTDPQNPIVLSDTTNVISPSNDGDFAVIASNADGCSARADFSFCSSVFVSASVVGDSLVANGTGGDTYTFRYEGAQVLNDTFNAIPLQGYGTYEVTHYLNSGPIIGPPPPGVCVGFTTVEYCGEIPNVTITYFPQTNTMEASVADAGQGNYTWTVDGNLVFGGVDNSISLNNQPDGDYSVEINVNGCVGTSNTISYCSSIQTPPTITRSGNELSVPDDYSGYEWFLDGVALPNSDNATFTATLNGVYTVTVSDGPDCNATSEPFEITDLDPGTSIQSQPIANLNVYPNPAKDRVTIETDIDLKSLELYGLSGQLVKQFNPVNKNLDVSNLSQGIYFLKLKTNEQSSMVKLVLQK